MRTAFDPMTWDMVMDPDELLNRILGFEWHADAEGNVAFGEVIRYTGLIEELHGWMSKGGFPPSEWVNQQEKTRRRKAKA